MTIKEIKSEQEFELEISKGVVVADFFATWCRPCQQLSPALEAMAEGDKVSKNIKFIKIDVDECGDLSANQNVSGLPTVRVYKDGKQQKELVGCNPTALESFLINMGAESGDSANSSSATVASGAAKTAASS